MTRTAGARLLGSIAAAIVALAVVAAVAVLGPPSEQRKRRLDERRVDDLRKIETIVDTYWQRYERLPQDLDALARELQGLRTPRLDPERGTPYEFAITGPDSFRVCAEFTGESEVERAGLSPAGASWAHGPGRQCFDLKVKPRDGEQ